MAKTSYFQGRCPPEHVNLSFCQFSCFIVHELFGHLEIRAHFCQIFRGLPLRHSLWIQLALTAKTSHFQDQTSLEACIPPFGQILCAIIHGLFGDLEFQAHFCKKLSRTSFKTSAIEPFGPYIQNIPFSRSKRAPEQVNPPFGRFLCAIIHRLFGDSVNPPFGRFLCAIIHGLFGDLEFRPHFCKKNSYASVKTLAMDPVGPHDQNVPFSRSNGPLSSSFFSKFFVDVRSDLSYGASCPSRPKRLISKVKRALEQVNLPFCQFSSAIVHGIFGAPKLRPHFCQQFLWTSVKSLAMDSSMDFLVIWNSEHNFAKNFSGRLLRP
ncbi:hypothetical protein H5410_019308 [Solanum commersonii]|uniref:Uncharacterized protein n=1 Tax=Solanum commersonii TaxID=4109 RepID=A0A9J5Z4V2_SOLCO|nr:hypothetical protein H5410_019308 [Solanum commersonii]